MNRFSRSHQIQQLKDTPEWDVLIIGGGATGLGLAVDGASRGYKTLLAEQADFANGTSSRSTKLVHGGVRYLAQGNIRLVKEALKERGYLLKNAPHLTENVAFIIPCYSWFRGLFYTIGLKIYDMLAGRLSLGKSRLIYRSEVMKRLPMVKRQGLKCGVLYHDGVFDDARLAISLMQTAIMHNATVLNYVRVTALIKNIEGKVTGAVLNDRETDAQYEVRSRVVINATGVFADEILKMDNPAAGSTIRPSQGVHLTLNHTFLQSHHAIMIPHTDDGRVLFAVPWHGRVLIGTTDTPVETHSLEPRALEKEIDFILYNAGRYFSKAPERQDVLSVFAGLRPLAATAGNNEKTKEISRSHKVMISGSGLVSVVGGKWTTYRKMAEDTFLRIIEKGVLPFAECITAGLKLTENTLDAPPCTVLTGCQRNDINERISGSDINNEHFPDTIISFNRNEVMHAIKYEMARTVDDILARRIRFLFLDAAAALELAPVVAELMRKELGKSEDWKEEQITKFTELAKGYIAGPDPGRSLPHQI